MRRANETNRTRRSGRGRPTAFEALEARVCLNGEPVITSLVVTPEVDEGSAATLLVQFKDSRPVNHELTVAWGDGSSTTRALLLGEREVSLTHVYQDEGTTGTGVGTFTIEVKLTAATLLLGEDAVFVVDASGSTADTFAGSPVGDLNDDGDADTILDAEIAGFRALNQQLIDMGKGNVSRVSLVVFATDAQIFDMDHAADGTQEFTTPLADTDGNGQRDVDQALAKIGYLGTTNFEAALSKSIEVIQARGGTLGGNVIFLSDGFPTAGGDFTDEVATLKETLKQNVRAFGVGAGSSLSELQKIDPGAIQFQSTDELLNVLGGGGEIGGGTATATISTIVRNVAPTVVLGSEAQAEMGHLLSLTGQVTDPGVLDTITRAWTVRGPQGEIVATGSGESVDFTPAVAGTYTVRLEATDNDGGRGEATQLVQVNDAGDRIGPVMTSFERQGVHLQPTRLVIRFNEAMDPVRAVDPANYRLVAPGRDRNFGTRDDVRIALREVDYNPATAEVTLWPAHRLRYYHTYRLTMLGEEQGLTDLARNLLDGDRDGLPGGNQVLTFTRDGVAVPVVEVPPAAAVATPTAGTLPRRGAKPRR